MNAIFGKLSILCFIVGIVAIAIFHYALFVKGMPIHGLAEEIQKTPIELLTVSFVLMSLGFIFSVIGKLKKEMPQKYATIGFYLNVIPFSFCVVSCLAFVFVEIFY